MRHMTQHRGGAAIVGHRHRRTPWPPRSVSVQCMVCVVATSSLDVFESHTVALALSAGRGALVWWQQLPRWRCSGRRLMMCTLALEGMLEGMVGVKSFLVGPCIGTSPVVVDVELNVQYKGVFFGGSVSLLMLDDAGNEWGRLVGGERCGRHWCPS
jgi:hypothetical protein